MRVFLLRPPVPAGGAFPAGLARTPIALAGRVGDPKNPVILLVIALDVSGPVFNLPLTSVDADTVCRLLLSLTLS